MKSISEAWARRRPVRNALIVSVGLWRELLWRPSWGQLWVRRLIRVSIEIAGGAIAAFPVYYDNGLILSRGTTRNGRAKELTKLTCWRENHCSFYSNRSKGCSDRVLCHRPAAAYQTGWQFHRSGSKTRSTLEMMLFILMLPPNTLICHCTITLSRGFGAEAKTLLFGGCVSIEGTLQR